MYQFAAVSFITFPIALVALLLGAALGPISSFGCPVNTEMPGKSGWRADQLNYGLNSFLSTLPLTCSVKEFMQFFVKTVTGRCLAGTRTSVEEQGTRRLLPPHL